MLGKKSGTVAVAAAVQAKRTWLVSGATVTLNFFKELSPMGNETSHSGLQIIKFSWKLNSFSGKTQEGICKPFAPLRRGPDDFFLGWWGTMLNVAPVSTKYLSLVSSSVRKIKLELVGKCAAVTVACVGIEAAELGNARQR
jgi:hypothetical protein